MRTLRLATGLTQKELGILLGVSEDVIGHCERGTSRPTATVLLGCVYLFEAPATDLFPRLHREVVDRIQQGAARCDERWRGRTDPSSLKKLGFLQKILDLSTSDV
jgi:DNA-binding XRE family transcriptional regulator